MTPTARKRLKHMDRTGDLAARVRQMRPVALTILEHGFDDDRVEFTEDIPCEEPSGCQSDAEITELIAWTQAVYAIGIAVGLLLRPAVFDKVGGAR